MEVETCYMCEAIATSQEHAPPKVLFPELKDLGEDYRINLITVPSCDQHNNAKSSDDEFLHFVLLLHINSNEVAKRQFDTKLLRAFQRTPTSYQRFMKEHGPVSNGKEIIAAGIRIDRLRFNEAIKRIARALYFKNFNSKWSLRDIMVISPNFVKAQNSELSLDLEQVNMADNVRAFVSTENLQGSNPEVFQCRLKYDVSGNAYATEMIFYQTVSVYTYSATGIEGRLKNG